MNTFTYLSYRAWLCQAHKQKKSERSTWTLGRLADCTSIQAPYLTNVMKERAHLSADQLFAILEYFKASPAERDYLLLLQDWERSSLASRKSFLKKQIDSIQEEQLRTEIHIQAPVAKVDQNELSRYYIDPHLQLIYAFLGIERFSQKPTRVAECLSITEDQVDSAIQELRKMGLLVTSKGKLEKTKKKLHLPKDSYLCWPQQQLMKQRSALHLLKLPKELQYNFMVTFTADENCRKRIQLEFLQFLSRIESWVHESDSTDVHQMNFELFPWTDSR